jgi:hypothetical protein
LVAGANAESLGLGRAGKRSTVNGDLKTAQGLYGHDAPKLVAASPYTSLVSDDVISWATAGGACVQALPAIGTVRGQKLSICKITADANTVTIDPSGLETINGAATLVLLGGLRSSVWIYAPLAGTDWLVLARG